VADLRILPVTDDVTLLDWQRVHNEIIPTAPLSVEDIRERATRNALEVAYYGDALVGTRRYDHRRRRRPRRP